MCFVADITMLTDHMRSRLLAAIHSQSGHPPQKGVMNKRRITALSIGVLWATAVTSIGVAQSDPDPIAQVVDTRRGITVQQGSIIGQGTPIPGEDRCSFTEPIGLRVKVPRGAKPVQVAWHFDESCRAVVEPIVKVER